MKELTVIFHLNDDSFHEVILTDCNMQQAYDFGQQKARDFNAIRIQAQKPERIKEVSIRFPIEYSSVIQSH